MRFSHRHGFIDRESYVAQFLALALFTIGVASSLGTDDLLAAFAAGRRLYSIPYNGLIHHGRSQARPFLGMVILICRSRMKFFLPLSTSCSIVAVLSTLAHGCHFLTSTPPSLGLHLGVLSYYSSSFLRYAAFRPF
jgi:hypothetical protein